MVFDVSVNKSTKAPNISLYGNNGKVSTTAPFSDAYLAQLHSVQPGETPNTSTSLTLSLADSSTLGETSTCVWFDTPHPHTIPLTLRGIRD